MEEHYFHPVAEAVVRAARNRGFVHMHHEEVQFIVAHGVKTIINNIPVLIGSRHFLEEDEGISFTGSQHKIKALIKKGKTLLYIAYNHKLLGTISLTDNIRDNAQIAINRLKQSGIKNIVMLTGDTQNKADNLANSLGITQVYAELQPTEKAEIIKQLQQQGQQVAFVGDGINDAPALISANVGFSMHHGADITKATADIALLRDDIEAIADARELAQKTMQLINANFNATVGVNTGILTAATLGFISPITTAILHNGTTIILLLNSIKGVKLTH
jgi:P-type E1-E2 ATPase